MPCSRALGPKSLNPRLDTLCTNHCQTSLSLTYNTILRTMFDHGHCVLPRAYDLGS